MFVRLSSTAVELALTQQNLKLKEDLADDLESRIQTGQQSVEKRSE